jgi:hypothetical protein
MTDVFESRYYLVGISLTFLPNTPSISYPIFARGLASAGTHAPGGSSVSPQRKTGCQKSGDF